MGEAETLLAEAIAIGDKLARDAFWHADRCTWIAAHREPGPHGGAMAYALESSLYGGTAGIALFLHRLARVSADKAHARAARGAIRHALRHAWHVDEAKTLVAAQTGGAARFGPYLGTLGVAWAADEVGETAQARRLRKKLLATRRRAHDWDLVGGTAGALALLAGTDEAAWLARDLHPERARVAGFAHGLSGAAYALSFVDPAAAREAFAREHALPRERESWCHGAPGMGLARALAMPRVPGLAPEVRALRAQAQARLDAMLASPGDPFHLCCGAAGVAACLHVMDDALGESGGLARARAVARWGLERYQVDEPWRSWPTGALHDAHPALMQGLAGIGHWLLELARPGEVPSLLAPRPS